MPANDSERAWRKASRCANGACVEVARAPDIVHVRNAGDQDGSELTFTTGAWTDFLAGIRAGDFDGRSGPVSGERAESGQ